MLSRVFHEWERRLAAAATDPATSPGVRALAAMLTDAGGVLPRKSVMSAIGHLEQADRQGLRRLRVRLGPRIRRHRPEGRHRRRKH